MGGGRRVRARAGVDGRREGVRAPEKGSQDLSRLSRPKGQGANRVFRSRGSQVLDTRGDVMSCARLPRGGRRCTSAANGRENSVL